MHGERACVGDGGEVQAQRAQVRTRRRDAGERPIRDLGPDAGGELREELAAGRQDLQRRAPKAPPNREAMQRWEAAPEVQCGQRLLQGDVGTCPDRSTLI